MPVTPSSSASMQHKKSGKPSALSDYCALLQRLPNKTRPLNSAQFSIRLLTCYGVARRLTPRILSPRRPGCLTTVFSNPERI